MSQAGTNILQDDELRLRPFRGESDVDSAIAWYQEPEVLRDSEGEGTEPYDRETVERMYRYLSGHGELYIIEVRENEAWQSIGDVTLCPDMIPIVIGDARYRGHGIGPRVIRILIGRAKDLGWKRVVVSKIYSYNQRSRRMFESLGFRCTGEFIDDKGRACMKMELMLDSN
ncbi:GNAT family N-acetyltransferase [Alicyclobacillus herbarius]|uniref:GNAT family N-acetyltransferase n=1 Tax=Alicyclobacillus herbarius TaxID=122960 RepID=UPI002354438C|nr:GNAT family N-acetyltransferase [Alicyclobacillus herbarius]